MYIHHRRGVLFRPHFLTIESYEKLKISNFSNLQIMHEVLKYLYVGKISDIEDNIFDIYEAAEKLQIESLRQLCLQAIVIDLDNFGKILLFAQAHNIKSVENKVFRFIKE